MLRTGTVYLREWALGIGILVGLFAISILVVAGFGWVGNIMGYHPFAESKPHRDPAIHCFQPPPGYGGTICMKNGHELP